MGFISTIDAGKKWNLSKRRVAVLCSEGRIVGAQKIGNTWLIPEDAEKPSDARIKNGQYIKSKYVFSHRCRRTLRIRPVRSL